MGGADSNVGKYREGVCVCGVRVCSRARETPLLLRFMHGCPSYEERFVGIPFRIRSPRTPAGRHN